MFRWPIFNVLIFAVLVLLFFSDNNTSGGVGALSPTESSENGQLRAQWLELMHRSAPDVDWQMVEHRNQVNRAKTFANTITLRSSCEKVSLADDRIKGFWKERGSVNQAGSVIDTEYDPIEDQIWLISAGGSLWRGNIDGNNWKVINQSYRFSDGLLKFIDPGTGQKSRLLAIISRIPHFSDDRGLTWERASGIEYQNSGGNFSKPVVLELESEIHIFLLSKPTFRSNIVLFHSDDFGESYHAIATFNEHDFSKIELIELINSSKIYCLIKETQDTAARFFEIGKQTPYLLPLPFDSTFQFYDAPSNLTGIQEEDGINLYAYNKRNGKVSLYASRDTGLTWKQRGVLPTDPWEVGVYISPSNPKHLFYGEVDCFRSSDRGATWQVVNNWWEYYSDPAIKLHADIMHFGEFKNKEGQPFLLISHHGGLSISYDHLASNTNLSLHGLNVSQYYSVRTDPNDATYLYAGSQDQGIQLADSSNFNDQLRFKQISPGDFGHLSFTNNGHSLWAAYPGGSILYYENAQSGKITAGYELDSEDESIWLAPITPSPFPRENAIYMAGGNLSGGPGSHLIKLEADDKRLVPSQLPYDFKAASAGGAISAIAFSPLNPNLWYVATSNGRFFTSKDAGKTWEQNLEFIPQGQYLYGQTILPSAIDEQVVYLGGSGYSNPSVYVSKDQGFTFNPVTKGLPSTLVIDLTANEDESLLFAATESGPYVFVATTNQWYSMASPCLPNQTYWSAEYILENNTVRFGTYGRGIWDFNIDRVVTSIPSNKMISYTPLELYPNPSNGQFTVKLPATASGKKVMLKLFDVNGRLVFSEQRRSAKNFQMNFEQLEAGYYFLSLHDQYAFWGQPIIIQH